MIQSNELRTGNVLLYNTGKKWVHIKCESVQIEHCEKIPEGFNKRYKPVEVTRDVLTNLGFKKIDKGAYIYYAKYFNHYDYIGLESPIKISISDQSNKLFLNDRFLMFSRNLHVLQNIIFAITGTELDTTPIFK